MLQRVSIVVYELTIVVDGCICVSVYMIVNDDGLLCWIVIKSIGGDALYLGIVMNMYNGRAIVSVPSMTTQLNNIPSVLQPWCAISYAVCGGSLYNQDCPVFDDGSVDATTPVMVHSSSYREVSLSKTVCSFHLSTSPVLLLSWLAYFHRTLPDGPNVDRIAAYERHMKFGKVNNYWSEFVFEAYLNHRSDVIFLEGLPDVPESRPHSGVNS